MWPELCARRLVTSPVTQIDPTCFSSSDLTCAVNSETDKTLRVCSVRNNSPKSHCALDLLIKFKFHHEIHETHEKENDQLSNRFRVASVFRGCEIKVCPPPRHGRDTSENKPSPPPRPTPARPR